MRRRINPSVFEPLRVKDSLADKIAYITQTKDSRTSDRDFRSFVSHIPVSARGKQNKNKRTAACRSHAGRTSNRDVIVMLIRY